MTYNLTQLKNAANIFDIVKFANDSTTGVLFGLFMVAIFFVMTFALLRFGFDKAILTSSFICFVLSAIASYIGFLTIIYPLAFLAIVAFVGLYVFFVNPS